MKKRVLSAALSLCMLLTLLPTAALATGDEESTTPGTSPATTLPESENGVIKLTENVALSDTTSISADTTLDLNGYTVSAETTVLSVTNGAKLIVQDSSAGKEGKISSTNSAGYAAVQLNAGRLVLESGCIESTQYGVSVFEGSTATINGGSISSEYACLSGNNTKGDMNFIVTGGTLTSTKSEAIYMPGQVTLDISGGVVKGGISARMGQIKISGGEIYGMTTEQAKDSIAQYWNYSGSAWIGDAIYVWGGTYTSNNEKHGNSCNIEITGGKINGESMSAIAIYNIGNNYDQAINLDISGDPEITGDVKIISGDDTWNGYSSETHAHTITSDVEISGGTFSVQPNAAFLKPGLSATQTEEGGTFSITPAAVETVYPAILADQADTNPIEELYDKDSYTVKATQKQEADTGDYYTEVAISVANLKKHTNGDTTKTQGHWIGIALAAPEGTQKMKYAFADSKDALTLSDPADLEQNVVTVGEENKSGIAFYLDAGSKTPKTWAQVQWLGEGGAVLSNTVYHMDLSGVTLAMDTDSAPAIRPAKLHDNAETNAYKDEELYTAGSYDAKIISQGAGGVYNVAITAQQLREHTNNGTPKKTKGYWVGFELTAPETATQFKYASGATIPDDAEVNPVETLADGTSKGVAFYFNAQNKATRTITVQWTTDNGTAVGEPVTFSVDLSGVAYYQAPSHGGSGSSGGSASTTYTLTFETNGGNAIAKVTKNKGTTIDLAQYAPTKSGATFEGWYADKGLTKKITSVKLDANTTVYAKWTEAPVSGLPFGDVKSADWFYNDVKYVYEKGMMAGTAADVFAPNATTTRAMIVTILYRLEGSPAVTGTSAFADVPAGQWYTDAVNWAAANQIVKGTSATTFAPNASITREQMAAILYRYAQYKGYDVTKKADLSGYSDNGQVSAYAKDALAWANAAKLINGVTNTTLAPQGNATRAQVSAILHRFCDGVVK